MNRLDYVVLITAIIAIPLYGVWRTTVRDNLGHYLKGDSSIRWGTIGLSVLATQAGPITFLSLPGQAYESGIGFVQNYFGQPLALITVCAIFVPIFQRLKVFTAYQYLGERFDGKTRLLGAVLFLIQRSLATGITIYAPAIVLSALLGWQLNLTIWLAGGVVVAYTAFGGTKIVSITQRYQILVIFVGMAMAFIIAVHRLPQDLSFGNALSVAGAMGKLQAVDFSMDPHKRYTFWSGILGGFFLALSYFGADQSQVQRYLAGGSLTASRFGLLFNSVVKVPMQFLILLLGAMVFLFYQFEEPPMCFNQPAFQRGVALGHGQELSALQKQFDDVFAQKRALLTSGTPFDRNQVQQLDTKAREIRDQTTSLLEKVGANTKSKDSDYVFITFVVQHLPHGVVGLLVAVILCATMSATAATLNALGSTSAVDLYRPFIKPNASDRHYVVATQILTIGWGLIAIGVASFASLVENLIEAGNILGSIFYGTILGLFVVAFFVRKVGGSAVFFGALLAQTLVLLMFWKLSISYLWYNVIGCVAVLVFGLLLQQTVFARRAAA